MRSTVTHVVLSYGGGEYSACGLAFDARATESDVSSGDIFKDARPGLRITCSECCEAIRSYREDFKGLRLTK